MLLLFLLYAHSSVHRMWSPPLSFSLILQRHFSFYSTIPSAPGKFTELPTKLSVVVCYLYLPKSCTCCCPILTTPIQGNQQFPPKQSSTPTASLTNIFLARALMLHGIQQQPSLRNHLNDILVEEILNLFVFPTSTSTVVIFSSS